MTLQTFFFNPYRQATYVLSEGKHALIIDAGIYTEREQQRFAEYFAKYSLTPVAVLITHAHEDHVCGLEWLKQQWPNIMVVYQPQSGTLNLPEPFNGCVNVIPTPGHKPDAVCYYLPQHQMLFSGDTLFQESVGRTDLQGGDYGALIHSLQLLKQLPPETNVYPGHGYPTTIAHEITYNPYL